MNCFLDPACPLFQQCHRQIHNSLSGTGCWKSAGERRGGMENQPPSKPWQRHRPPCQRTRWIALCPSSGTPGHHKAGEYLAKSHIKIPLSPPYPKCLTPGLRRRSPPSPRTAPVRSLLPTFASFSPRTDRNTSLETLVNTPYVMSLYFQGQPSCQPILMLVQ